MKKINIKIIKTALQNKNTTEEMLSKIKRGAISKTSIKNIPKNVSILKTYKKMVNEKQIKENRALEHLLKKRKVRTLSGVASISVILHPFGCLGKCVFCPTEKNLPKSYLKNEPAIMRAIKNNFDPYKQMAGRINALKKTGHTTDKIELIVIGGTWSYYPQKYRIWYIKRCFEAANGKKNTGKTFTPKNPPKTTEKKLQKALEREQKINELSSQRIIGLTLETRPDFINEKEIMEMRALGATRVEIGVQNINERVLKKNIRDHGIKEIITATRLLKDAGFKVTYHMMPGLWGSSKKTDIDMFKELFSNEKFKPDYLKIYPCVVLKNSPLYKLWLEKKYKPRTDKELITILSSIKKIVPRYVRIIRIIRDIPSSQIIAGGKISNLREIVKKNMRQKGWDCKCIRCREIKDAALKKERFFLFRQNYKSSKGLDVFLSFENKKRVLLCSFLRMRLPSHYFKKTPHPIKELRETALIRELHTYGPAVAIGKSANMASQHKGLGKKLLQTAEHIAKKEFRVKKMAIISGIGARNYYKKLGYKLDGTYMIKKL